MGSRVLLLVCSLALALGWWIARADGERQSAADSSAVSSADHLPAVFDDPQAGPPQPATQELPTGDAYCLTCHSDESLNTGFADGRALSLYADARALRDSAHSLMACVTCHGKFTTHPRDQSEPLDEFTVYQTKAIEMCSRCHLAAAADYAGSAHWQPIFSEGDGATCIECHSPASSGHSIARTSDTSSMLAPERIDAACGRCHQQALSTYRETSHGKVARFGEARTTAICTTCHSDHDVKAVDDPSGPLAAAKLVTVCASCHPGADEAFASAWPGHSEGAPSRSAADYVERFGFFSTVAIVGFGLVHVSLDFLRRLTDRNRRMM